MSNSLFFSSDTLIHLYLCFAYKSEILWLIGFWAKYNYWSVACVWGILGNTGWGLEIKWQKRQCVFLKISSLLPKKSDFLLEIFPVGTIEKWQGAAGWFFLLLKHMLLCHVLNRKLKHPFQILSTADTSNKCSRIGFGLICS